MKRDKKRVEAHRDTLVGCERVKSSLGEGRSCYISEVEQMWNFELRWDFRLQKKCWVKTGKPFYDFRVEVVDDGGNHRIWAGTSVSPA